LLNGWNGKEKRAAVDQSGCRRRIRVSLRRGIENGPHGNLLRASAAGSRLSTHLRSVEISVQILGPIGVASVRPGRVLWVTHFYPFHTRPGGARARLS